MNGLKENECPDLLTLVKVRSSVRSFKSSKVERAKLEYILEVARLAPSAVVRVGSDVYSCLRRP